MHCLRQPKPRQRPRRRDQEKCTVALAFFSALLCLTGSMATDPASDHPSASRLGRASQVRSCWDQSTGRRTDSTREPASYASNRLMRLDRHRRRHCHCHGQCLVHSDTTHTHTHTTTTTTLISCNCIALHNNFSITDPMHCMLMYTLAIESAPMCANPNTEQTSG